MTNAKKTDKCRAVIRDCAKDVLLADTLIKSWDKNRNIIRLDSIDINHSYLKDIEGDVRVTVLIMLDGKLMEYNGVLRGYRMTSGCEVALSQFREREYRNAIRYNIDVDGIVEGMTFYNQKILLKKPIWVRVENISKTGLLIHTFSRSFEVGDIFSLLLEIQGTQIRNNYEIVRKQEQGLWLEKYGCKRLARKSC